MNLNSSLGIDQKRIASLPVFDASLTANTTALVTIKVDLGMFEGYDFDKLLMLKLRNDAPTTDRLPKAGGWADMSRGKFIVTDTAGTPQSGRIEALEYLVSIAIEDGSVYDWNPLPNEVIDPAMLALEGGAVYSSAGGAGGGGMPGGCATGAASLTAFAALGLLYKRKNSDK
jgi:hypothetical protein